MAVIKPFDPAGALSRGVTLIEASAGTGKTYTITSLMLRLVLEERLSIDQVLVVTFTEAATAELRDRTRQRFREAHRVFASASDGVDDPVVAHLFGLSQAAGTVAEDASRLESALTGFDEATISTIHGFCNKVLLEHDFDSGAPVGAELIPDEGNLREEVVRDFWIRELHSAPLEFFRFLVASGKRRPHLKLSLDSLADLGAKACSQREMTILPRGIPVVPPPPSKEQWAEAVDAAATIFRAERRRIEKALDEAPLHKRLADKVPEHLDELDSWLSSTSPSMSTLPEAASKLATSFLTAKTKKSGTPPRHPFFDACERLSENAAGQTAYLESRALDLLLRFVPHVRKELALRKRRRRLQSFDDLLYNLSDALRGPLGERLIEALSQRFEAVLIDEFQDTDPIQYEIFERIFGNGRAYSYLIGDPKQAIYSFRGADIYAYLRAATAAGERCFTLETNWRSDLRLVKAIEHLFSRVDAPFVERDINFIAVGAHQKEDRLLFPEGPRPPLCLRCVRVEDQPGAIDKRGAKIQRIRRSWLGEHAPVLVACEVAELLSSGASIDGHPVEPGDVAVLVRKNDQARDVQTALRELQIPSVLHGAASVFHSPEAMDLRQILAAVVEPSNPRRIKAALATETLGYQALELVELEHDELGWEAHVDHFRILHQLWTERGFITMARALIDREKLPARLLSLIDGERRLTNLLHLAELFHTQEQEQRLGTIGLLRWFDLRRQDGGEDAERAQLRLESDERAVQLVTIHKAKGLQYPIVICPYLWDGGTLHPRDKRYPRFHDPDDDFVLKLDVGSEARDGHVARASYEARTEGLRLLYVALTRAQHRCVVFTGALASIDSSPLGYVLHTPSGVGDGPEALTAAGAACKKAAPELLYENMTALAATSGETIEVTPLTLRDVEPYQPRTPTWPNLRARPFDRVLDLSWRTASFTSLTSSAIWKGPAQEERYRDEPPEEEHPAVTKAPPEGFDLAKGTLHAFPRGAEAGSCLHAVLETLDFSVDDIAVTRATVDRRLEDFGFFVERWAEIVTVGLDEVLRTPIEESNGMTLRTISPSRRLNELEFIFPVAQDERAHTIRPENLAELIRRYRSAAMPSDYADQVAGLGFEPLTGYLKGFVDLVFEHDGRWYVVDYKSNHLGDCYRSYTMDKLVETMAHHHYYIQYLLYTVALHRYLTWRLPGYDFDRHFGGVYYLFLRGMSPGTGTECGVFHDRPARELIVGISEVLEGGVGL